jgi:hypothetical protein
MKTWELLIAGLVLLGIFLTCLVVTGHLIACHTDGGLYDFVEGCQT